MTSEGLLKWSNKALKQINISLNPDTPCSLDMYTCHNNRQYPKQVKDRLSGQDQSKSICNYCRFTVSWKTDWFVLFVTCNVLLCAKRLLVARATIFNS